MLDMTLAAFEKRHNKGERGKLNEAIMITLGK
jgi:hypothetical protein